MNSFMNIQIWIYTTKYIFLGFFILSVQILPLPIIQQEILWPDLLFLSTSGWLIRRPNYLPIFIIFLVHIVADIILLRPIGLWSGLSLIIFVFIKWRISRTKAIFKFGQELVFVISLFTLLIITNMFFQSIFRIVNPPLIMILLQLTFAIIIYPLVIFSLHYVLGVRYGRHIDITNRGQRRVRM